MKQIYTIAIALLLNLTFSQTIINPISATTTFTSNYGTELATSFNGAGLENFPSIEAMHDNTTVNNSFIAEEITGSIDFKLNGTVLIDEVVFWNINNPALGTSSGINEVAFSYSLDGTTYTPIIGGPTNFAEVYNGPSFPQIVSFPLITASYIRMTVISNHNGAFSGFNEIAFGKNGALTTATFTDPTSISVYPNPATNYIQLSNVRATENYTIYTILGEQLKMGTVSVLEKINTEDLASGLYFLNIGSAKSIQFLKE